MTGGPDHTAVFLGLGSIGRRHARLLLERPTWRVLAVRSGHGAYPPLEGVVEVPDLDAAVDAGADVAFVCSPPDLHLEQAMAAGGRGLHLFVEKPLSHCTAGVGELLDLVRDRGLRALVGTVLRHHPLVAELAHMVVDEETILHVRSECSSWLPDWRPGRDYRDIYSAHRGRGGGVVLDLIHELDLVDLLVGPVTRVLGDADHRSALELDCADHAEIRLETERTTAEVFLSWYAHLTQRWVTVYGARTTARLDLVGHELVHHSRGSETTCRKVAVERDELFCRQLDHFEHVLAGAEPIAPLETASRLLLLLEQGSLL